MSYVANKQYYDRPDIAEFFGRDTSLWKAEETILMSLRDEIRDKPLLEIGVGAGRTTPYLRAVSSDYVGIDYSLNMIELCRRRHADARLVVADARRMTLFDDGHFASVFWCFNGIDDVDAKDRVLILEEISRVLNPNGIFVFSSHNLDCKSMRPFSPKSIVFTRDTTTPRTDKIRRLRAYSANLAIRIRETFKPRGQAIVLEYEYSTRMVLPTYYIGKEEQFRQLLRADFENIKAYGVDGFEIDQEKSEVDPWLYYVARKTAIRNSAR